MVRVADSYYSCICECGKTGIISGRALQKNLSKSCRSCASKKKINPKIDNKGRRIRGNCSDCGIGLTGYKIKRCRKCDIKYRFPNFTTVKEYRRNWHLKKKYGIDRDEFFCYWNASRGECFLCNKDMDMPTETRGQGLSIVTVDHDHKTGKIRGLLCGRCNKGLGFFYDDVNLIKKAIIYLGDQT